MDLVAPSPFRKAVGSSPVPPSASSVPVLDICTPSVLAAPTSRAVRSSRVASTVNWSAHPRIPLASVPSGTSDPIVANVNIPNSICAPSAALAPITPVRASASNEPNGPPVTPFAAAPVSSLRNRIISPYNPIAVQQFINKLRLGSIYPFLVQKLSQGFRLGDLAPLNQTFTPPNHPSAAVHASVIEEYLTAEREKGRMSGPFSQVELESILDSHFRSSPVQVITKFNPDGSLLKARMAINLSFKDKYGMSVNDMIDSDDMPTRWGKASEIEEIVSRSLSIPFHN